jgi:hypothetical protein
VEDTDNVLLKVAAEDTVNVLLKVTAEETANALLKVTADDDISPPENVFKPEIVWELPTVTYRGSPVELTVGEVQIGLLVDGS